MSMTIYAATVALENGQNIASPVIPFAFHQDEILAEDADARSERGEDPFLPNPDFVPNASMDLSNANAHAVFAEIGLELDADGNRFGLPELHLAVMEALHADALVHTREASTTRVEGGPEFHDMGLSVAGMRRLLMTLLAIVVEGHKRGATHIVVV